MGMHVLQGEYVQKTLDLFDYKITVTAAPDETITTNETMYKHPEKTFLKDFGKLPKNRMIYSIILINRIWL